MKNGDQITIEASELVAGGAALAKVDGFPIFVFNVFPGDVALVGLVEVKKGFARAELIRIDTPSPLRRAGPCPVAGWCGGCDWTALRLDAQLDAKQRILTESLRRIGKFDPAALPPITVHPSPLNYRIRSRLHREDDAIGFYAMKSARIVPLALECEVSGEKTVKTFGRPGREVAAEQSARAQLTAEARQEEHSRPPFSEEEMGEGQNRSSPDPDIWEIDGQLLTSGELTIAAGSFRYQLSTETFFQVNRHLLETMLTLVETQAMRCAGRRSAIDLYAGVGFFTAPLARIFEKVTAVEGSGVAHHYAKRNAAKNVKLVRAPVQSWPMREADLIFLDPPRAGAGRDVIDRLAIAAREMICYLSCDPVTFARDAARLTASGWHLSTLDLLDLFPNTHHVETLASFERASG